MEKRINFLAETEENQILKRPKTLIYLAFLLWLCPAAIRAQIRTDSLFKELNLAISSSISFDNKKNLRIDSLKRQLNTVGNPSARYLFNIYQLCIMNTRSTIMIQHSAMHRKWKRSARVLHEDSLVAYAKIKMGFVLLSSGLFKETFDLLRKMNPVRSFQIGQGRILYPDGPVLL